MINHIDIANRIHDLSIDHPLWTQSLELAYAKIALAAPSQVVCVIGPSRVGKSRLSAVMRKLLNPPEIGIDDPRSLSIGVRASNCNTNGAFSTKAFARKAVAALNHPILATSEPGDKDALIKLETEGAYWLALERGLPKAGKRFVFIDEAQNVCRAHGKNSVGAVLDAWKCVAEDAGVVLVLTGTYQLHKALQEAPHVLGRKSCVHFPRYQVTRKGIEGFNGIIQTYADLLPLAPGLKNLRTYSEYLYSGSLGCIGLLERWFRDALAVAMVHGRPIDLDVLVQSRTCESDLQRTLGEIVEGEEMLVSDEIEIQALTTPPINAPSKPGLDQKVSKIETPSKQRQEKAFVCKPVRRTAGERVPGEVHV